MATSGKSHLSVKQRNDLAPEKRKHPSQRKRYPTGAAPRTPCFDMNCRANAHYQGIRNLRFYCCEHAAEVCAFVPLRQIDGLTVAMTRKADENLVAALVAGVA